MLGGGGTAPNCRASSVTWLGLGLGLGQG